MSLPAIIKFAGVLFLGVILGFAIHTQVSQPTNILGAFNVPTVPSGGGGGSATTTINGTQSASFTIQGTGSTTVSTAGSVISVNTTGTSINGVAGPAFTLTVGTSSSLTPSWNGAALTISTVPTINGTAASTTYVLTVATSSSATPSWSGLALSIPTPLRTFTTSTITYDSVLAQTSTVVSVVNTTTPTTAFTFTLPGNTLGTNGNAIHITAFGTTKDTSSTGAGYTLAGAILYNNTICTTMSTSNIVTSTNTGGFLFDSWISNASGTTNNQICGGYMTVKGGGTNTFNGASGAPIAIDSTAAQALTFRLTLSVADPLIAATLNSIVLTLDGATTTVVTNVSQ